MFDYVKFKAMCWNCGESLDEFQTKDGDCNLRWILPKRIPSGSFYASCFKCKAWNEYDVVAKKIEIIFNEKESKLSTNEKKT